MKKLFVMAAAISLIFISCVKKEGNSEMEKPSDSLVAPVDNTATAYDTLSEEAQEVRADVMVTVDGKVTGITQGKDGQTAELTDDSGKKYYATISIPNLKDPKEYRAVKVGDRIIVKGESWKMEDGLHIKVTEIKE